MIPVMVLAAGRGERMRPLTHNRAKPALPVFGVPLVARIIRGLASQGMGPFAINAFHQQESLREALLRFTPPTVEYDMFTEQVLMGTGGALFAPRGLLEREDFFLVHNGDTLAEVPVKALQDAAGQPGCLGSLLVRPGATPGYGAVRVENGAVRDVLSPTQAALDRQAATYLGVSVWRRELLAWVPAGGPSDLFRDVVIPRLAEGWRVTCLPTSGPWLEFTSPAAYARQLFSLARNGEDSGEILLPGGSARLDSAAGEVFFIASGSCLDPGAVRRGPVILESGARAASGADLSGVVLLEGAEVADGTRLERVVVDRGLLIPPGSVYKDGVLAGSRERGPEFHPFGDGV